MEIQVNFNVEIHECIHEFININSLGSKHKNNSFTECNSYLETNI